MKAYVRALGVMSLLYCAFVSSQIFANTPDLYLIQSQQEGLVQKSALKELRKIQKEQDSEASIEGDFFLEKFSSETLLAEPATSPLGLMQVESRAIVSRPEIYFDELAAYDITIEETHRSRQKISIIKSGLPLALQGFPGNVCSGNSSNQRLFTCHMRELRAEASLVQSGDCAIIIQPLVISVLQNYHSIRQGYGPGEREASTGPTICSYFSQFNSKTDFPHPGLRRSANSKAFHDSSIHPIAAFKPRDGHCYLPRKTL